MKKLLFVIGILIVAICVGIGSLVRFDVPVKKLVGKYTNANSRTVLVDGLKVYY